MESLIMKFTEIGINDVAKVGGKITQLNKDINTGKGPANAFLKDSSMVVKINNSLNNIEKGTDAFSQNMEALKHNFLFRGYFRKLEKQKNRERQQSIVVH